jgi:hypothetical protein
LSAIIRLNFTFPAMATILVAAMLSLILTIELRKERPFKIVATEEMWFDLKFILRLVVLVGAIIMTPIVCFPAFAQEVSLYGGTNFVWLGFAAVGLASLPISRMIDLAFRTVEDFEWSPPSIIRGAINIVFLVGVGLLVQRYTSYALINRAQASMVYARYATNPHQSLEALRAFATGTFMTNINVPTVYFFTQRPGFGVCGIESVDGNGAADFSKCKIAFMKHKERYFGTRPDYFFRFKLPGYFPGFADCAPWGTNIAEVQENRGSMNCFEAQAIRLNRLFPVVFDNSLVSVYLRK